jgi:hypothetical protein
LCGDQINERIAYITIILYKDILYLIIDRKVEEVILSIQATIINLLENHFLGIFIRDIPKHDSGSSIPANIVEVYLVVDFFKGSVS